MLESIERWGAELIPDEDILHSQFPQVLAELEQQHARLAELQALFAAASEEDFEDLDGTGVLPAEQVKDLKALIKSTLKNRDELVEQARLKISPEEARKVILLRLGQTLFKSYRQYLRADQRACVAAIENLWRKYAVTAKQLEAERDRAAAEFEGYLVELGYE